MSPLEAIPREKVFAVIAKLGPVQPLDVRRELGSGDTMLIGAILSEMAANGLVGISRTKRGGSPFYYDPKRPETLEKLSNFLGEKDRQTWEFLRAKHVLREDALDPLTRVSLQNIPDFSRRFIVQDVPHWRYYLVSEQEAMTQLQPKAPQVEEKSEAPPETRLEEPEREKQTRLPEKSADTGSLYEKVSRFAGENTLSEKESVKDTELTCLMTTKGKYGKETFLLHAFSRKTLPETLVWKALLNAKGLPLIILKDSPFPKSLEKKFSDVPNIYFKRL